ncbi:MAG: hypothetical protein HW416_1336 [Chloroflexi bacterium]|nr:hypothetical protein [Chloroflexota bacterium]
MHCKAAPGPVTAALAKSARLGIYMVTCASVLSGCQPSLPPRGGEVVAEQSVRPERVLVVGVRVEPSNIVVKPLINVAVKLKTSTRLFNAALDLIDGDGNPQPYLAEALPQLNTETWKVLADGKMETTYRLKTGLVWHDGSPLTAEDFVFSWRVYSTAEITAASSAPQGFMNDVSAPDPRTIVIRWSQLYPGAGVLQDPGNGSTFPPLAAHVLQAPYDEAAASGAWEAFTAHPYWTRDFVGAGPYRLERWEPGASFDAIAFDRHILGAPKIQRVRVLFLSDANTALTNLLSGGIDMAADTAVGFSQGVQAKRSWAESDAGRLLVTPDLWHAAYFQFRPELVSPPALLDVNVRRAIAHAIDKQGLNAFLYEGEGIVAETFIAPGVSSFAAIDRAVAKYPYDLRRSEQLMNQAGFVRGSDGTYAGVEGRFTLELKVSGSPQNESARSVMASGLRQAGFDIQETSLPASQAQDGQARANYPGLFPTNTTVGETALRNFTTTSIPTPANRWTGNNRGGWFNPGYTSLVAAYNSTLDSNERVQQLTQLTQLVADELPAISMHYDLGAVAYVAALRGPGQVAPDTSGSVAWNIHEWEFR